MTTTLRYSEVISLTSTGPTANGLVVFAGNNAFSPLFTGTGHQPMMYDQYASVYDRYVVYSSTISVTWAAVDDTPTYAILLPCVSATQIYGSTLGAMETAGAKTRYISGTNMSSGLQAHLFSRNSTARVRGEKASSEGHTSRTDGAPTDLWFWHVIVASTGEETVVSARVAMTMKVKFFKRTQPVIST